MMAEISELRAVDNISAHHMPIRKIKAQESAKLTNLD